MLRRASVHTGVWRCDLRSRRQLQRYKNTGVNMPGLAWQAMHARSQVAAVTGTHRLSTWVDVTFLDLHLVLGLHAGTHPTGTQAIRLCRASSQK